MFSGSPLAGTFSFYSLSMIASPVALLGKALEFYPLTALLIICSVTASSIK
jgi:uncharacterized membrane protein